MNNSRSNTQPPRKGIRTFAVRLTTGVVRQIVMHDGGVVAAVRGLIAAGLLTLAAQTLPPEPSLVSGRTLLLIVLAAALTGSTLVPLVRRARSVDASPEHDRPAPDTPAASVAPTGAVHRSPSGFEIRLHIEMGRRRH
jgi:hypothetical protein